MNQMTFSGMEYSGQKRVTQKEKFLDEMIKIIPRAALVNMILPYYPTGKRGRPPRGIEVMLRMYLTSYKIRLAPELNSSDRSVLRSECISVINQFYS